MLRDSAEKAERFEQQLGSKAAQNQRDYLRFCETTLVQLMNEESVRVEVSTEGEFPEIREMLDLMKEADEQG